MTYGYNYNNLCIYLFITCICTCTWLNVLVQSINYQTQILDTFKYLYLIKCTWPQACQYPILFYHIHLIQISQISTHLNSFTLIWDGFGGGGGIQYSYAENTYIILIHHLKLPRAYSSYCDWTRDNDYNHDIKTYGLDNHHVINIK